VFAAFTDGVNGHAGAKQFARSLNKVEAKNVRAAVNLTTLGLSFTRAWADDRVMAAYLKQMASSVQLPVEIEDFKGVTKAAHAFQRRGIPAITIHTLNKYNKHKAGTPEDTVEAIKRDEYYESYMLIASYLAFLDQKLR
jgi:hypothetical protein